jgi:phytoene desaturase
MRIVVIGSGFGGLSAAIRLQAAGHDVTILERRDKPGGRAYVYEQDGYTFDGGPTIITAPWLIDELFELAGSRTADWVRLVKCDPYYNIRFTDGSVFRYDGDREHIREQIRRFNPDDLAGYERFFEGGDEIFRTGFGLIDKPFHTLGSMAKVLPDLVRLRADRSVAGYVNRFIKDERLRQVFSFHPLLVGGNPFQTTSIYTLIHTLEQRWGVWFAMGGTGALVRAFVKLFQSLGGEIRLEQDVAEIEVDGATRRATGVRLADGTRVAADAVVSNADVADDVPQDGPPRGAPAHDRREAQADEVLDVAVRDLLRHEPRYDDIAHHEILMGPRYEGLLREIFGTKTLAKDFSLYLHRPTATDPTLAPPGGDAFYVLSRCRISAGPTDWATEAPRYRDAIMQHLERHFLPDLSKHLVTETRIDPLHFQGTLNSYLGSAFSVEPTLMQSAWMRPHNRSEDVENLYLAGAGTHPGAGLPGVMSSGKIVADLIGPAAAPRTVASVARTRARRLAEQQALALAGD